MIRSLADFTRIAKEKGPKKLAVLAPEDEDFMRAVKTSWEMGYIEPVLIGNSEKMERVAAKVDFDIGKFEKIPGVEQQGISDLGIRMLFSGELPIASKGQIPTSYIYRSIIREEAKAASGMTVSVVTFWEIPGIDHLVVFTDTGVNIKPDARAKAEIIKNAAFVYHLMGVPRPRVAILSGHREVGGDLASYRDYRFLRKAAAAGELGECEIVDATSFTEIFRGSGGRGPRPETSGGRCPTSWWCPASTRATSSASSTSPRRDAQLARRHIPGAGVHPARSDFSDNIVQQLAMCVVLADRMERRCTEMIGPSKTSWKRPCRRDRGGLPFLFPRSKISGSSPGRRRRDSLFPV